MSVRASPDTTRKGSPARPCSAFFTLPAVPSGTDSVAYDSATPYSSPAPKYERMLAARYCTVTTAWSIPCMLSSRSRWPMIGSPTTGSSGLGTFVVRGRRRVPSPPAITTARTG